MAAAGRKPPVVYPDYEQQSRKEHHDRLNFVEKVVYDQKAVNDQQEDYIFQLEERLTKVESILAALHVDPATIPVEVVPTPPKTLTELLSQKGSEA